MDHEVTCDLRQGLSPASIGHKPRRPPEGKAYGYGKGYFEYRVKLPTSVTKAHPESILYLFQSSSKAKGTGRLAAAGKQTRLSANGPGADLAIQLTVSLNGRLVDRVDLPDDAADARGVLSHLSGVEHGSHGELVDGKIDLNDLDRARLDAGEPLVIRLSVPDDATHPGGLCLYGAQSGEFPLDPTLQIHTRDTLPADLGVTAHSPLTVPSPP